MEDITLANCQVCGEPIHGRESRIGVCVSCIQDSSNDDQNLFDIPTPIYFAEDNNEEVEC